MFNSTTYNNKPYNVQSVLLQYVLTRVPITVAVPLVAEALSLATLSATDNGTMGVLSTTDETVILR